MPFRQAIPAAGDLGLSRGVRAPAFSKQPLRLFRFTPSITREIGGEDTPPPAVTGPPPVLPAPVDPFTPQPRGVSQAKPAATPPPIAVDPFASQPPGVSQAKPPATSPPIAVDPFASQSPKAETVRPDEVAVTAEPSAQELIGEYKYAQSLFRMREALYSHHEISLEEFSAAQNRRDRALNRIEGQVERYRDELELLRVRLKKQQAEVQRAKAQSDYAAATLARMKLLQKRVAVSSEEVTEAESKSTGAAGSLAVAQADLELIEVLARQTERHLAPLQRFLESNKPPVPAGAKP